MSSNASNVSFRIKQIQPSEIAPIVGFPACLSNPISVCPSDQRQVGVQTCGGVGNDQPLCSKINTSLCPMIGDLPPVSIKWVSNSSFSAASSSPNLSVQYDPNNNQNTYPEIECTYDTSQFKSATDVAKFNLFAGTSLNINTQSNNANNNSTNNNTQNSNNALMSSFCLNKVTTCPINPITNLKMASCSRFTSTENDGNMCRDWINSQPDKDQILSSFCSQNATEDCGCYLRNTNEIYKKISSNFQNVADNCWFKPCASSAFLIPQSLSDNKVVCPDKSGPDFNYCFRLNSDEKNMTTCPTSSPSSSNVVLISFLVFLIILFLLLILGLMLLV
jgi:hypothetical protein